MVRSRPVATACPSSPLSRAAPISCSVADRLRLLEPGFTCFRSSRLPSRPTARLFGRCSSSNVARALRMRPVVDNAGGSAVGGGSGWTPAQASTAAPRPASRLWTERSHLRSRDADITIRLRSTRSSPNRRAASSAPLATLTSSSRAIHARRQGGLLMQALGLGQRPTKSSSPAPCARGRLVPGKCDAELLAPPRTRGGADARRKSRHLGRLRDVFSPRARRARCPCRWRLSRASSPIRSSTGR